MAVKKKKLTKLEEYQRKYKDHFFAAAPEDPRFPGAFNFRLVDDENSFSEMCFKAMRGGEGCPAIAVDTETTSLSHEAGEVVGFSVCFDDENAYYVPLRHRVGTNLDPGLLSYFRELLYAAEVTVFFNARFDLRFLTTLKADRRKIRFYDAAVPLWVSDTNIKMPSLKEGVRHFLGWNMITYSEALGDSADLSFSPPEEVRVYAGADALGTWHLMKRLDFIRIRHPFTVELDNKALRPISLMEETPTPIDLDMVMETRKACMDRMEVLEREIHAAFGKVFLLSSGQQIGEVLAEHGLDTGKRTDKTQKMKTGADELDPIKDHHPGIPMLLEYKKLHKFVTTYANNLMSDYDDSIKGIRFAYNTVTTPTGRLAAKGEPKNPYFSSSLNVQAIDKAEEVEWGFARCEENKPGSIKGWEFTPPEDLPSGYEGPLVEGFDPHRNLRKTFRAYPGHLWVHLDYKAQELRIPANLSGEPVWVEAFLKGEDLHHKVAAMMWGADQAAHRRKYAKALNFGALYGGSKYTFARQLGCPESEAQDLLDEWWSTLGVLRKWVRESENRAKKQGWIETAFGRPRRVRQYFASKKWGIINFGKRTAVNTQVQGAGADIVKIAMYRVFDEILDRVENDGRVNLISCVHDELNFSILNQEPFFTAAVLKIKELMQIQVPGWKVPMLVDIAIGDSWGNMFPMDYDSEKGMWIPRPA